MKLITEEIRATTPFLYETENVSILEKKATAKFFTPLTIEEIYQERGVPLPSWILRKKEEMV